MWSQLCRTVYCPTAQNLEHLNTSDSFYLLYKQTPRHSEQPRLELGMDWYPENCELCSVYNVRAGRADRLAGLCNPAVMRCGCHQASPHAVPLSQCSDILPIDSRQLGQGLPVLACWLRWPQPCLISHLIFCLQMNFPTLTGCFPLL